MTVDWDSASTVPFANPRLPSSELQSLHESLAKHKLPKGHICIATSGSSGPPKWVLLSKQAILASAAAVSIHLESTASDIWLKALPTYHVGGLSILARAHLCKAKVVDCNGKWAAERYFNALIDEKITLTSLVPAQLYDIVKQQLTAPPALRAVFIGGGVLPVQLYSKAKALGWNLLPTYGMTECASQVATADLHSESGAMQILPHLQAKTDKEGHICIKGESLLTAYIAGEQWIDPKVDGWYRTEDLGSIVDGRLTVDGRIDDFIKIGGLNTNLARLNALLQGLPLQQDAALFAHPDERLGSVIHLAVEGSVPQELIEQFNAQVAPFERIRKVHIVDKIPRSSLGKLLTQKLNNTCN